MEAKDSTEDIVAKASMGEAALTARTEWEALRVEAPVTLEEAFRVEAAFMVEAEATLEAAAVTLEEAAAVTTDKKQSAVALKS
jgi:hypothetical protein